MQNILEFINQHQQIIYIVILMIFFSYNMLGLFGKMLETGKNKEIAEAKLIELKESKDKLDSDISKLNTNQGLEESIREKFGLVKEGENMIVIVDEKKEEEVPLEASTGGFFSFFINLFR